MNRFQMQANLIKIIASFIKNRTFQGAVQKQLSQTKCIQAGAPQGSVLGLVIYSIYTNDVPNQKGVKIARYDIAILAQDRNLRFARALIQKCIETFKK